MLLLLRISVLLLGTLGFANLPAQDTSAILPTVGHDSIASPTATTATPDTLRTFVNYDSAKDYAEAHDLDILMVYAGSDWCRPCKLFKRTILSDDGFKHAAGESVVLLYLDFPAKRSNKLPRAQQDHNDALAERYNPSGVFPKILLFDTAGEEIGELVFEGQDPTTFAAQLAAARIARG